MLTKTYRTSFDQMSTRQLIPLNVPDWKQYNMIKVASAVQKDGNNGNSNLGGFDIKKAAKQNPEFLYVKCFAIKENEVNDNGDCWTGEQLKKTAHTFIGVPLFCNHQNDDIEKARGKVVHAWYDEKAQGIYTISAVDRVAYPKLARGIQSNYVIGTSMGCAVTVSVCSCCGNAAKVAQDYCDCVKNRKNRSFSGKISFAYGKNGVLVDGNRQCPVKFAVDADGKIEHKAQRIYQWNFGSKFIENSFVVNPACHSCGVKQILNTGQFELKVANLKDNVTRILKAASCNTGSCSITKTAGMKQIEYLNSAMSDIQKVAKSMLAQKQNISMQYVSQIVTAMADLQSIMDELVEMGYAQLPSPSIITSDSGQAQTLSSIAPQPQAIQAPIQTPKQPSGSASSQQFADVGGVTVPKTSQSIVQLKTANLENFENKKDFDTITSKLANKISHLSSLINNIKTTKENNMSENIKTAAADVTTEKQLENAKIMHKRTNDVADVVIEKQLDKVPDVNLTTSDSPLNRTQKVAEVTTEKQLDTIKGKHLARWNQTPEVITEKQWTQTHRMIGSELSMGADGQKEVTTQKQLADFLSKHKYVVPEVVLEKQLNGSKSESGAQVKAAMSALASAIAFYHKTPSEVIKAAQTLAASENKAAYLTLVNALPHKIASRKEQYARTTYFSKMASRVATEQVSSTDAVIASLANELGGFSANDIVKAAAAVSKNENAMKKVQEEAKKKMDSAAPKQEQSGEDKFASALAQFNRPQDGIYKIEVNLDDKNIASPAHKKAFFKSVIKVAAKQINDSGVDFAITNIDIDEQNNTVIATAKDVKFLTAQEMSAHNDVASTLDDPTKEFPGQHDEFSHAHTGHPHDDSVHGGLGHGDDEFLGDAGDIEGDDSFLDEELSGDDGLDAPPAHLVGDKVVSQKPMFMDSQAPVGAQDPMAAQKPMYMASGKKTVKTAQAMGDPMGGAPGAGGAGATMPAPPAPMGAAPAAQPPLQSFEQSDIGGDMEDESNDVSASPPGSKCPVCGSDDVDVVKGSGKCNNCSSEFSFEVNVKVTRWSGLLQSDQKQGGKQDDNKAGFEMPAQPSSSTPPPAAPGATASTKNDKVTKTAHKANLHGFAAVTKLTPAAVKLATANGAKIGDVSPFTGSTNTIKIAKNQYVCLDTGSSYGVQFAHDAKKNVFAKWTWNPFAKVACASCDRQKDSIVKALKTANISVEQFDAMEFADKAKTLLSVASSIKEVKTASKQVPLNSALRTKYASIGKKEFPMSRCVQKLANRFGEDAVALSGPCEGKPLHDCVCKSLKNSGIYSEGMATKIASTWVGKDPSDNCVEDCVKKLGLGLKQASTVCSSLKKLYAEVEDFVAEEIQPDPNDKPTPTPPSNGGGEGFGHDIPDDVFGDSQEGGSVSIELPLDLINQLESAIDVAKGENPANELHHSIENGNKMVQVDLTSDTVNNLENVAQDALNNQTQVQAEDAIDNEVENKFETNDNPGVMNNDKTNEPVEKQGNQEKSQEKEGNDNQSQNNEQSEEQFHEKSPSEQESQMDEIEKQANAMKSGKIIGQHSNMLDLSGVMKVLKKNAGKDSSGQLDVEPLHQKSDRDISLKTKQIKYQNVQDAVQYPKGKALMGDQKQISAKKPEVPSGKALLGKEVEIKQNKVAIPAGSKPMGDQKLDGGDVAATGGDDGAGNFSRKASTRESQNRLADRMYKIANEKKLEKAAPVSDDKDIKPISGKSLIGKEVEIKEKEVGKVKSDSGFIGKEKESLKSKPDAPKDQPSIPVGDAKIGKEQLKGEKETKIKGTVIAESSEKDAIRVAGRMLQSGKISVEQLSTKISELKQYKTAQILDLEKAIFASQKGFDTDSNGGIQSAVVIKELSNVKGNELTTKISSLFKLDKQVKMAEETDAELRKQFGR